MAFVGLSCTFDMWSSVFYHLYHPMGKHTCQKLLGIDMAGIVAVMLSNFTVCVFHLFADWEEERKWSMIVMIPMLISNFFGVLHPACLKPSMLGIKVAMIFMSLLSLLAISVFGFVYMSSPFAE